MKLSHNISLKQTQKLSMTPELQQAIMLLQFNSLELNDFIKDEIEINPLLEIEVKKEDIRDEIDKNEGKESEIDWKEYIEKYDDISYKAQIDKNKDETRYENFISYNQSLKEHLLEQVGLLNLEKRLRAISEYIIENLDDNGYLKIDLLEITTLTKSPIELVQRALSVVQSLEPVGVGAADLKECLLLQIKDIDDNLLVKKIIENHLEDLALNRVNRVAKELNIDINTIQKSIDIIKTLEPKPGRAFNNENLENVKYITPDASIELIDGVYKVSVNETSAPRLIINNFYKDLISNSSDKIAKEFLTEKLNSATWIIKSIEQRKSTIKRVVESILEYQMDFFTDGEKYLKPLTLKTIADDIDMHESTISRTTNGKYVQTPRGVFELKYFFTSAVTTIGGDLSSTSIKSMIEDIIKSENSKKPYSDQKIADMLKERGSSISRRTVAKYRDELQIASSTIRKRFD